MQTLDFTEGQGYYWGVKVHVSVEFVGSKCQWSILVSNMFFVFTESSDTTNYWS